MPRVRRDASDAREMSMLFYNRPTHDATATSTAEKPSQGWQIIWEAPRDCRKGLLTLQLWLLESRGLDLQLWWKHLLRQWMTSTDDSINATLTNLDVCLG